MIAQNCETNNKDSCMTVNQHYISFHHLEVTKQKLRHDEVQTVQLD